MFALCEIHKAGVQHGSLQTGHILQKGYSPCIVDFSAASEHCCSLYHGLGNSERPVCKELYDAECFLRPKTTASIGAYSALGLQGGGVKVTSDGGILLPGHHESH
jgi:hypothetical protein